MCNIRGNFAIIIASEVSLLHELAGAFLWYIYNYNYIYIIIYIYIILYVCHAYGPEGPLQTSDWPVMLKRSIISP